MSRQPKTAMRLRKLTNWLAAEHGIRADTEHVEGAAGRWQWWLRWYDGPAELPSMGQKAEELGVDTSLLMSARVITGQALAVQAARIARNGCLRTYRDPTRLAAAVAAAASGSDYPERAAGSAEESLAASISRLAEQRDGYAANPSAVVAELLLEHADAFEHIVASKDSGQHRVPQPARRPHCSGCPASRSNHGRIGWAASGWECRRPVRQHYGDLGRPG